MIPDPDAFSVLGSDVPELVTVPPHTLGLPVGRTVTELRAALRQVPGSARLRRVSVGGADTMVSLTDLVDVSLTFAEVAL